MESISPEALIFLIPLLFLLLNLGSADRKSKKDQLDLYGYSLFHPSMLHHLTQPTQLSQIESSSSSYYHSLLDRQSNRTAQTYFKEHAIN